MISYFLPLFYELIFISAPAQKPYHAPIMSHTSGLVEGDYISFICTANVGKPIGSIRWWKLRNSVDFAEELSAKYTTQRSMQPWVCEYNITSYMTMTLTENDDQAIIRCSVDQPGDLISSPTGLPQDLPYNETERINVQCECISLIM